MRRLFVETPAFRRRIDGEPTAMLSLIQNELLARLETGDVIGLRKLRVPDPARRKGKRGGFRVIYLDLPHVERTYLLALYDKGERLDISNDEKKLLRALAALIRKEVSDEED
jgi:hypothetical protein